MRNYINVCLFLFSFGLSHGVFAGIIAENSRIIFDEGMNQQSLMIANTNKYPIIVQTWIDNGDVNNTPEKTDAPFIVLPAVFKMNPNDTKGLRIMFKHQPLPDDRESLYWLNIYEIPPKHKSTSDSVPELVVAMNTQMKIFYRPKALANQKVDLLSRLQFSITQDKPDIILNVTNPTGYYASFSSIKLLVNGQDYKPEQKLDVMVSPQSSEQFVFKQLGSISQGKNIDLTFMLIDDHGRSQPGQRQNIPSSSD
ncbi:molecular chaperone [Utexia brackfieldae]|uniref:fimbrial biogenesis chaperone n=1 Tax=Utexia brackfieldae TaxID=3074108 RepID=UPI00370D3568